MKFLIFILLIFSAPSWALKINGKFLESTCSTNKAMIWLSTDSESYKDRKLLLHTLVPLGGTFSFYVRPGDYQVRGSDEKGCESFAKISIKDTDENLKISLKGE